MNARSCAILGLLLVSCTTPPPGEDADLGDSGSLDARWVDGETIDAVSRDASVANTIAVEPADEAALARLADLGALPIPTAERLAQVGSEDRNGGPPYVSSLFERGNRDMSHFVCLGELSDVREPNVLPFRYDLPACPEPYVRGAVIARFEGTGALVRLWATFVSARGGPLDRERLRIYVDDETDPVIDVSVRAAMDGTASPIFAPPFGAAAPDHLAWYYPVVFSRRIVVALDGLGPVDLVWHQVDVRLDAEPSDRHRASMVLPGREAARASLERAGSPIGELRTYEGTAAAGARVDALTFVGGGTIRELRARAASRDALEDVSVAITWDGQSTSALELPLLELFGAALDAPPTDMSSVVRSATDASGVTLTLALPMPFMDGAVIAISNEGPSSVDLAIEALLDPAPPSTAALRLHAERNETLAPATGSHHPLARATGRGLFVGACLMMEGHALDGAMAFADPLNFLEGDERVVVDGEPVLLGTGTEDFLDGAFYFERGTNVGPFAYGVATSAEPIAHASGCRWYIRTNAIDFTSSLDASLEIGPGDASVLDRYQSVSFVYR